MRTLRLVALYVVSMIAAFAAGAALWQKHSFEGFGVALSETQAMLWFNHLLQFREIEADLEKNGCEKVALEKTKIAIDGEMRLLSSFHEEHPDSPLNKYISDRDAKLLGDLKGFKSKYGDSWTVPQCGAASKCGK
jgi:hypothetical protein